MQRERLMESPVSARGNVPGAVKFYQLGHVEIAVAACGFKMPYKLYRLRKFSQVRAVCH